MLHACCTAAGSDGQKLHQARPEMWSDLVIRLVVGTGVDPVTFRFSGGRSAN